MKQIIVKNCRSCPYLEYQIGKWWCKKNVFESDWFTVENYRLDHFHPDCKLEDMSDE